MMLRESFDKSNTNTILEISCLTNYVYHIYVVAQSVCHGWCVQPLVLGKYVDPVCYVGSQND